MKKYILTKIYPNSPPLGATATITPSPITGPFYRITSNNVVISSLTKDAVEGFPEYWQPVIEKDYEILSFRGKLDCLIFHRRKGHPFIGGLDIELSETSALSLPNNYEIYSVKRLSDGEVFTIGDSIKSTRWSNSRFYKLEQIIIKEDKLNFVFKTEENTLHPYSNIDTFVKEVIKQKIFTTEDGVDIFEGDKYFYKTFLWDLASALTTDLNKHYLYNTTFSTKEAVQEYIIQNKPCLSFKEVVDYLVNNGYLYGSKTKVTKGLMQFSYLKTKIKKKLE